MPPLMPDADYAPSTLCCRYYALLMLLIFAIDMLLMPLRHLVGTAFAFSRSALRCRLLMMFRFTMPRHARRLCHFFALRDIATLFAATIIVAAAVTFTP